jgi:hypothetical protein
MEHKNTDQFQIQVWGPLAKFATSESPGFSSANAGLFGANVLLASQSAPGPIQFHETIAEKGDSGLTLLCGRVSTPTPQPE